MKRKPLLIGVVLAVVLILGLILTTDNNPKVPYDPNDGLAMALTVGLQLKAKEGLEGILVAENPNIRHELSSYLGFMGENTSKVPPLAILVVRYHRSPYPAFVRSIGAKLGAALDPPYLETESVCYFNGMFNLDKRGRHSGQSLAGNTDDPVENRKLAEFRASLKSLEPNGNIRLHSDYLVVQCGDQTRIYRLESLPKNVAEFYEFARNRMDERTPAALR